MLSYAIINLARTYLSDCLLVFKTHLINIIQKGEKNMKRKKPIYMLRENPILAQDKIKPYGDRIDVSSEALRNEMALKLLTIPEDSKENRNIGILGIVGGEKREKTTIADALRELHNVRNGTAFSEEEQIRFMEIQTLISNKKKISLSFEGLMRFLLRAMNYNAFQLEEDAETRLKAFLGTVTDEEVLALYDVEESFGERNLRSIDNFINTSEVGQAYGMQVNESGDGTLPNITEASREKAVKALLR